MEEREVREEEGEEQERRTVVRFGGAFLFYSSRTRWCVRARVLTGACVCMCVCIKWNPGCSPIHSEIINDQKQAFSRVFG